MLSNYVNAAAVITSMVLGCNEAGATAKIIHLCPPEHNVYYPYPANRAVERVYVERRRAQEPKVHKVVSNAPHVQFDNCNDVVVVASGWNEQQKAEIRSIACSMVSEALSGVNEINRHVNGNLATGVVTKLEFTTNSSRVHSKDKAISDGGLPKYERNTSVVNANRVHLEFNLRLPVKPEDVPLGANVVVKVVFERGQ